MSIEEVDKTLLNREAALLAAADADEARRITELWAHPQLADNEVPVVGKFPPSLWAECKRVGDTPPLFQIGRRLFVRTDDLRAWLDEKAKAGRPGSKRLRAKEAA